ncbi:MAG: hypothetical protein OEV44_10340, partial [Spirochaetota bacterium]|nr:hypothetical protein [Spirochaetota bacterium]
MDIFDYAIDRTENVEIISSETESQSVSFESDLFKKVENTQSQGIGLRTIHNDKIGFSFSNDFDDKQIVDRALESAEYGEKACFSFSEKINNLPKYKLFDPEVEKVSIESMVSIGERV